MRGGNLTDARSSLVNGEANGLRIFNLVTGELPPHPTHPRALDQPTPYSPASPTHLTANTWVRGCVGAWVRGCVGAWVRGCVGARGGRLGRVCTAAARTHAR